MSLTFTKSAIKAVQKISFVFLLFCFSSVYGQLIPISLDQRIDHATAIIEGKVISQTSHWDENKTHIYTSNIIEIYKVFKGNVSTSRVEMITRGGIVGNDMQRVSHSLELTIGDTGIFTAIPNTAKLSTSAKLTKLKTYAGLQGFIKYDIENGTAKDVFNTYKNVTKDVYAKISARTKSNFKTIQKAPFKIE